MSDMDVLSSRVLIHPRDPVRSRSFYRDVLGLAVHREFGPPDAPGTVFFLGNGLLEVSGHSEEPSGTPSTALWLQVRDARAEYARVTALGGRGIRPPQKEFWGLVEAWIADPDGVRIVLVEVPVDHPLRKDQREF
ncbi:VOC family protein [Nocardiopsis alba]|uniref:VOC family protein n=3 Tax=Nocardiopsis alba TaxID=53437 RepID=A0A7K2IY63_9ACTN|nr:VOC family protein [Nocardiopsis alba]